MPRSGPAPTAPSPGASSVSSSSPAATTGDFVGRYTLGFPQVAEYARAVHAGRRRAGDGRAGGDGADDRPDPGCRRPRVGLYVGNGLEHHENGVNNIRAVAMLDALLGTFGHEGGTFIKDGPALRELTLYDEVPLRELGPIGADRFPVLYDLRQECHTMTAVGAILEGDPYPLRAMIVTAANPVLTNANSGRLRGAFEQLDLLVVRDLFMTETAALADYVLPAASFLERTELHAHAKHQVVTLTNQVFTLPEVQGEYDFWRDLAVRLGAGDTSRGRTRRLSAAGSSRLGPRLRGARRPPRGRRISGGAGVAARTSSSSTRRPARSSSSLRI